MRIGRRIAVVGVAVVVVVVAVVGGAYGHGTRPAGDAAGGAEHRRTAVTFLRSVVTQLAANRYAKAWASLVADQQRLVSRETYVRCESLSPIPGRLARISPISVRDEGVVVPGADADAPRRSSVVVVFRLRFVDDARGFVTTARVRAHALQQDGRWAWMLPAERLELHRTPDCGTVPVGDPANAL